MKKERKRELIEKGWREEEIKEAEDILERGAQHDIFFSKMVFWSALVVIIFANLMVSLVLIPFLIVLNSLVLYTLIAVLAATVGFLYNFLITDIGLLEKKHHKAASVIVPLIALGNIVVMVLVSNRFIEDLKINQEPHNPWLLAIIFGVAFILPYIIDQIRLKLKKE